MPRPQVSIERLPTRRMSNEPRESMNCKSCRKRKIKCNRLRPACEACQVFQCPCIYDAVPKKRGPKTDVLEALLKRVDGLEARLKDKKAKSDTETLETPVVDDHEASTSTSATSDAGLGLKLDVGQENQDVATLASSHSSEHLPGFDPDVLLDIYFARFHDKPFHVFDESTLRQRLQLNQVPGYLVHAIYAVAARYAPHPSGYQSAVKLSEEYAAKARFEIDTDEPSIDALQGLVLLVTAFTASGKGKKAYMLLTSAVGMAMALELHRELDMGARITPIERETRRRLFWTCYLLDRFLSCGSKRPSLISDRAIVLRLPCWFPSPTSIPMEGDFFQSYTNLQQLQGGGKKPQGSNGMLIDICRILGTTNQYLAAGGVKGDSHFPWHSLSNLSKIRQDLDVWASGSEDVFSSVESLFGQPDSTVLVLSKLIYHLIHCLIYRPFLPIDLAELAGSGQHQSWQIEATNMCFLHANAIAELVELGKQMASVEWPAFVGYCICTAGTVHIHGAHYSRIGAAGEVNVFSSSTDFLSREMQQLSELRYAWASVQHQRETLQGIYNAHSELVKSIAQSPTRYSPVFTLEDFFDRYSNIGGPGGQSFSFDSANLSLADVVVDFTADTYPGQTLHAPRPSATEGAQSRPNLKRKNTAPSGRPRPDLKSLMALNTMNPPPTPSLSTPSTADRPLFSPSIIQTPTSLTSPHDPLPPHRRPNARHGPGGSSAAAHGIPGFSMGNGTANPNNPPADLAAAAAHGFHGISNGAFAGSFNFAQLPGGPTPTNHHPQQTFDPMFGGIPTNAFSTPTAWHAGTTAGGAGPATGAGTGSTPKDTSPHESAATTGPGEEKDPFLSLLEQLAENESFMGGVGPELDFFLNGAPNTG
ncbi:fungal transcriptional regulatory-like protein [Dichotomopilus funicola]|uniref:Fungal transcriptional regulatory-like protein n=1 Tax=Dichotomopilus funicola TaxID=1934379 RepID=A0AAN6VAZ3_9PEZI|nr:fungal transcriptional regulatory-like protein [Dichotomopilus funicola]